MYIKYLEHCLVWDLLLRLGILLLVADTGLGPSLRDSCSGIV